MSEAAARSSEPNRPYVRSLYFFVPGQGAWNCPVLYRRPELARRVETRLRAHAAFTSVRANFWTGRVSLWFDAALGSSAVSKLVEAAIASALSRPATMEHAVVLEQATVVNDGPSSVLIARVDPQAQLARQEPNRRLFVIGSFSIGLAVAAHVAHRALELFPRRFVGLGMVIWVSTSAGLAWVNLREVDDRIRSRRRHAVRQLYYRFARPYRRQLMIGLATTFASRAAHVGSIVVVGGIIDAMLSKRHESMLGWGPLRLRLGLVELGLLSAGLIAATNVLDYYSRRVFMRAAHQISHDLRIELYEHIQSIELRDLADAERGLYLTMLHEDTNRIELLLSSIWTVSRELSFATCALASIYMQHPGFGGMVALPLPGLLLVADWLEKHIRPRVDDVRGSAGELGGQLSAALDGIETIRAFVREPTVASWIAEKSDEYRRNLDRTLRFTALYDPLAVSVSHLLRSVTALVVGQYVRKGEITTGSYVTMVMLSAMLSMPLKGIARDLPHILSTLASLSRVFELFNLAVEDRLSGKRLELSGAPPPIAFREVGFAYRHGAARTQIFHGFSVDIEAGKVTAFVGETGSGKSTLAKLLLRFHDPDTGTITLGGQDLATLRRTDVRSAIAYVGQDIFLFNGSVANNIAFSAGEIDTDVVHNAARAAEAHEFIETLPQGYATITGERGVKLSGGQRQRIGIARALYELKPIVILDESTSALDAVTETSLLGSLTQRLQGRTVIIIAHRLSAVASADRIHVLDRGEIVESGSHNELLSIEGGRYATFWSLQTQRHNP